MIAAQANRLGHFALTLAHRRITLICRGYGNWMYCHVKPF
jgi:hypothetical protein